MNNLVDCRDRTAEFFSTVQQIQRAQNSALIANGVHASMDGTSHRPLPMKHASSLSYGGGAANGASSNGFHSEFDERPDEALLGNGRSSSSSSSLAPPPPKQQSQFAQAAQHIGRSIHMVTEKLEKLGKLAKQRSLFNDPASEINELTYVIKTDLSTLSTELEVLHNWVVSHRDGTASSASSEALSVHAARNSSAIVDNLKQQLMTTTKSFQEVLQVRTSNLKAQNQARKQFEASGGSSSSSSGNGAGGRDHASPSSSHAAASMRPGKRGGASGGGAANPFGQLMSAAASSAQQHNQQPDTEATSHDDEELSFLTPGAGGSLLIQSQEHAQAQDQTDEYLASRAQAVEDIEGTIVQLGQMYQKLVHIVGMQEEITLRIDANMDSALDNMDKGHRELVTLYDSISGGRWLILKIFAVLLAFLIFFMVFVA